MIWQYFVIAWVSLGGLSFIITQNIIKGWGFIKAQPNPIKIIISSTLMGPITTLICLNLIIKYIKGERLPELK